jgi:ankyrin repeat protein
MDAAGSAVGVASLGIQICQGLVSYYNDWRSYHEDISTAYDKVASLERIFQLLKETLGHPSLDAERKASVYESLLSCTGGIRTLEKRCTKLHASNQSMTIRERAVAVTKRTIYPFKASTLAKVSEAVDELLEILSLAVQALHLDLSASTSHQLGDVSNKVDDVSDQLSCLQLDVSNWRRDDQFQKVMSWLNAPDHDTHHAAALQKHEPGTGDWLLQSETYKTWRGGTGSHLWLHGKAGCGKSVMCSSIIEDLKAHCKDSAKTVLAFYYFSFSDSDKNSYRSFLASTISQLCVDQRSYDLLKQLFDNKKQAPVNVLEEIVLTLVMQRDCVVVVLDALDGLTEEDDRQLVLTRLCRLATQARHLKLLMSSRELTDIEDAILSMGASILPLSSTWVNEDISRYIISEFSTSPNLRRWPEKMRHKACDMLARKADGMYAYRIDNRSIEDALQSLPVGLDATYQLMLDRIDRRDRHEAVSMLRWLSFALRPLILGELQEARLVDPAGDGVVAWDDPGEIEDIVEILGPLIGVVGPTEVINLGSRWRSSQERGRQAYDSYRKYVLSQGTPTDRPTPPEELSRRNRQNLYDAWMLQDGKGFATVRLAHFSVKEYLVSTRVQQIAGFQLPLLEPSSQRHLADTCLIYLFEYSRKTTAAWPASDSADFPLLDYAARNWPSHVDIHDSKALQNEMRLLQDSESRAEWLKARDGYHNQTTALYCACELGHQACVKRLLELGEQVNTVSGSLSSKPPLHIAAEKGHHEIVQILLDAGADANRIGSGSLWFRTTALYEAALKGHDDVVAILLDAGSEVKPIIQLDDTDFGVTALYAAAAAGHGEAVKQLITAGSDVNTVGYAGPPGSSAVAPALYIASANGHENVVGILIEAGADPNGSRRPGTGRDSTPPSAAPWTANCTTALHAAAVNGHINTVHKLIDAGSCLDIMGCVDVAKPPPIAPIAPTIQLTYIDAPTHYTAVDTALHAASTEGHYEIVSALIDSSADIDAIGYSATGDSFTPLCAASKAGQLHVVLALLAAGATTSNPDPDCRQALFEAVESGHADVVEALVEAGADVNARSGLTSAVGIAAAKGYTRIVTVLTKAGARTGFDDYLGHTALMIASAEGWSTVVMTLIDEAPGPATALPGFEEAIDIAAKEGHMHIEQLLLDQFMISQLQ